MKYCFLYKCRRCEQTFHDVQTTNKDIAYMSLVEVIVSGVSTKHGNPVSLFTSHRCEDGGYGMSDLQGFDAIEEDRQGGD